MLWVDIFAEGVTFLYQIEIAIILFHTLFLKKCVTRHQPDVGSKRSIIFRVSGLATVP